MALSSSRARVPGEKTKPTQLDIQSARERLADQQSRAEERTSLNARVKEVDPALDEFATELHALSKELQCTICMSFFRYVLRGLLAVLFLRLQPLSNKNKK